MLGCGGGGDILSGGIAKGGSQLEYILRVRVNGLYGKV